MLCTGCFRKSTPLKLFGIFSLWLFGNSYPHRPISTKFCRPYFYLNISSNSVNFSTNTIVFTLSSFEYSPKKWKCSVPAFRKWRHVCHCVSLLSDFLLLTIVLKLGRAYPWKNVLQRQTAHADASWAKTWWGSHHFELPWIRVKVEHCEESLQWSRPQTARPFCINQAVGDLPQRLHAQFVVVRQFSHW